jgi:ribosomal protein L11 methylase PrmA
LFTKKRLALSGILIEQVERVTEVFSEWIELRIHAEQDGWTILDGEL